MRHRGRELTSGGPVTLSISMRTQKKRSWDAGARTLAPEDIVTGLCDEDVRSMRDCWRPGDR